MSSIDQRSKRFAADISWRKGLRGRGARVHYQVLRLLQQHDSGVRAAALSLMEALAPYVRHLPSDTLHAAIRTLIRKRRPFPPRLGNRAPLPFCRVCRGENFGSAFVVR